MKADEQGIGENMPTELKYYDLHTRHHGLSQSVAGSYAEAATVCFDRHHQTAVELEIKDNNAIVTTLVNWPKVSDQTKAVWNNNIDATEAGASAIALAAVEQTRGLVAVSRAETATGADYYIDKPGAQIIDLETSYRLEISGTDASDHRQLGYRLTSKIKQSQNGKSNLPAIACVVGFAVLKVAAEDVS